MNNHEPLAPDHTLHAHGARLRAIAEALPDFQQRTELYLIAESLDHKALGLCGATFKAKAKGGSPVELSVCVRYSGHDGLHITEDRDSWTDSAMQLLGLLESLELDQ